MITPERVKEVMSYNSKTGLCTNLVDRGCAKAGTLLGSTRKVVTLNCNTITAKIDRKEYRLTTLIHILRYGFAPRGKVVFLDGDSNNLRWANLRWIGKAGKTKKSTDYHKDYGVVRIKASYEKRYKAQVRNNGVQVYVGQSDTKEKTRRLVRDYIKKNKIRIL